MKLDQKDTDDGSKRAPRAYQLTDRPLRLLAADETPPLGAHLVTPWMGFAHHGIYVGDGKVVHYGALVYDIIRRPVEEVTLASFAEGRPVFVVQHAATPFSGQAVIGRARSRLGEDRYRVLTNNCEHFVEWCLYGVSRSFQVTAAITLPSVLAEWFRWRMRRFVRELLGRRPVAAPVAVPVASDAERPLDPLP
jgi:hypothetical protein